MISKNLPCFPIYYFLSLFSRLYVKKSNKFTIMKPKLIFPSRWAFWLRTWASTSLSRTVLIVTLFHYLLKYQWKLGEIRWDLRRSLTLKFHSEAFSHKMTTSSSRTAFLTNHAWACWAPKGNNSVIEGNNGTTWVNESMIEFIKCSYLYFKQTK